MYLLVYIFCVCVLYDVASLCLGISGVVRTISKVCVCVCVCVCIHVSMWCFCVLYDGGSLCLGHKWHCQNHF
jgi:hypothetical protein